MCSRSERLGKERFGVEMPPLEVWIENHREIADKDAAEPGGTNFVFHNQQQAVFARSPEPLQFRREVSVEVDAKLRVDFFFRDDGVAEQPANDCAANMVVGRKMVAAHGCEAAIVNRVLPVRQIAMILRVSVAKAADCRNAHAVEVGASLRCITLKIAVQRALLLRDCKLVARLCEMVHPDVAIARVDKLQEPGTEDFKFLHTLWKKRRE